MIVEFDGYRPRVAESAFIAPTAVLIGNVIVGEDASIWYGAVLRGDQGDQAIVVGDRSNVQDNAVIHVQSHRGTVVGNDVTIGHGAIMEACDVEDGSLIGINAVILEGVRIGARSLVAANSTVLAGTQIPPESLVAGSPARVKRPIEGQSLQWIERSAPHYVRLSRRYRAQGLG